MNYSIFHKNNEISFSVERRNRKSLSIQVHPDLRVRVLAPRYTTSRSIIKLVSERAEWILKKQKEFTDRPVQRQYHEYSEGEVFKYLGQDYILNLSRGRAGVRLNGNIMHLTAPAASSAEQRRNILKDWYKSQSIEIFTERMKFCIKKASAVGIKSVPEWKSRVMKRSWGSCTGRDKIHLNQALAAAPVRCIDYVILHELCHLIEHNHSKNYYSLLNSLCPDWKSFRDELNREYATLI